MFNRPNSPGRGLKIIIDSLLLLSSWQLLVLTDPITYWPIRYLVRKSTLPTWWQHVIAKPKQTTRRLWLVLLGRYWGDLFFWGFGRKLMSKGEKQFQGSRKNSVCLLVCNLLENLHFLFALRIFLQWNRGSLHCGLVFWNCSLSTGNRKYLISGSR